MYIDAHAGDEVSDADRLGFFREVLSSCFTLDIEGLATAVDPKLLNLDGLHSSEFPRLDMAFINDFFPNLRCLSP